MDINRIMNDDLAYAILAIVSEIPEGKVLTYGQIAKALGREKNARLVGTVMSHASYYGNYPCHRVVNHQGRTAPGFDRQKELLEREGVTFKENDCVDLKKHRWDEIG